ncbi:MAG: hypothetical protein JSS93_06055 [Bacteroidetes bacterium]|nr:hypothetical protein [Bacteroidota bacterium]
MATPVKTFDYLSMGATFVCARKGLLLDDHQPIQNRQLNEQNDIKHRCLLHDLR